MNAVAAFAVAVLFGVGVHLMVRRDAIRLAAGTLLVSNSAVLLIASAGLEARQEPILPAPLGEIADPLVQAIALTAIVIGFGTTVLLLRVALAIERTHDSLDMDDLAAAELDDDAREQQGQK